MLFTPDQILKITENVDFFHSLFVAENIGIDVLSKKEKDLLKSRGIDLLKYKDRIDLTTYSHIFGKLESTVSDQNSLKKMNFKQYKEFLSKNPDLLKLSREDKRVIKIVKQQIANDIRKAAGDIKSDLEHSLIEVSSLYSDKKGSKKKILNFVTKRLKGSQEKYEKRFELISSYNMHSAFQSGVAQQLLKDKGENCKIYFSVHKDACRHCDKTYLTNGKGSKPKIFYLKTILKNGDNRNRKPNQYKASLNPLHPHCRCKMNNLPKGKIFWNGKQNRYVRIFS